MHNVNEDNESDVSSSSEYKGNGVNDIYNDEKLKMIRNYWSKKSE